MNGHGWQSRARYLEPAGAPAPALTGSMLVWAGIPRLGQLSWGWSIDRQAGEVSE